jgi:hypothetical protein
MKLVFLKSTVMKKYSLLLLITIITCHWANAQTISISGTVKTAQGDPLHLAFVQDKQYKYGAYTDSLGNFTMDANPNSKLQVTCRGFRAKQVSIDSKTSFSIVLQPIVNIVGNKDAISTSDDRNNDINIATLRDMMLFEQPMYTIKNEMNPWGNVKGANTVDMAQGAILPQFNHREDTKGIRLFFSGWMHGFVVNATDSTIQNPLLFFNYDKIGGSLLLTKDKHVVIQIAKRSIKSFTIFDELNQPHTFNVIPAIDTGHFVQLIAGGNNYSIYKLTKTEFIKSNFSTDGVASSGNHYDEYADENTYYVIGKSGAPQKIALKKKSLKEAFNGDSNKLNQYFSTNSGDIDDNYLKDLGDYMNK